MRGKNSTVLVLFLSLMAIPDVAVAGNRFFVGPGLGGLTYVGGYGFAGAHPFDDGYDYPFGYGEYAKYGPWVYRGHRASCYLTTRNLWTGNSRRARTAETCD